MFLFKSKEDKEKKRLEKKLQKELKNQSNINLSNVKQGTSSVGDDDQHSTSSSSSTLQLQQQQDGKIISSIVSKFELSPQLNAPPRPKKSILKGMSKFASVSSIQSHKSTMSSSIILPLTSNDDSSSNTTPNNTSQAASLLLLSTKNINKKNSNASNMSIASTALNLNELPVVNLYKFREESREFEITKEQVKKFKLYSIEDDICIDGSEFLLTGDRLVEINGEISSDLNKVKELLQGDHDFFKIKVKSAPEMYEFCTRSRGHQDHTNINLNTLKRTGSMKFKVTSNQSTTPHGDTDDVWIIHPNGNYSQGKIIQKISSPDDDTHDKFKIKLEANGAVVEISEDLVEKCACVTQQLEDLTALSYINETSILNLLRQRFHNSIIHTYMGNNSMIILRPNHSSLNSLYNDKVIRLIKGCKQEDMPPHIYAYTQSIYRNMLSSRQSHCIVLHGLHKSGKTSNAKHILEYLFKITTKDTSFPAKISSLFYLLDLFCDSNSYLNSFTIDLNHTGSIICMNLQLITMNYKSKMDYKVFNRFLLGADDSCKLEYDLQDVCLDSNLFINVIETFREPWSKVHQALRTLNFTQHEIKSIENLLAVIYHLGLSQPNEQTYHFNNQQRALKVASLLGITYEHLHDFIFPQFSSSSTDNLPNTLECLQSFCVALYQECLNLIVACINRSFKLLNQSSTCSLTVIDSPGFQTQAKSFGDMLSNYLVERLQLLFYQINFINPIEKCTQEGLDMDLYEHIPESPSSMVNLFDRPLNLQQRSSVNEQPGLLWLLDDADNSSFDLLVTKLKDISSANKMIAFKTNECNMLIVNHQFNQFQVEYNLKDIVSNILIVNKNISNLFSSSKKECFNETFNGTLGTSQNSLKRSTSFSNRKFLNNSSLVKNRFKIFSYFKIQLDSLLDSIKKTKINFIFCLLPSLTNDNLTANEVDCAFIRNQLKSYQLIASCRIYRQSYPDCVVYNEFKRRYSILYQNDLQSDQNDDKNICLEILKEYNLNSQIKLGYNKLFLKAGILNKLENERDDRINDIIIKLQSYIRRHLTQKDFQKKKIQTLAIKCIQKNIRNYFQIKEWKWWKLYANLKPLINVSETSRAHLENDLNELKFKYDKLQLENADLKASNLQLENKLMNLKTEYIEEHAANAGTLDLLEVETSERMRLESELNELRQFYNESLSKVELLETELLEYRLNTSSNGRDHYDHVYRNGDHDTEDGLKDLNMVDKLKRDLDYLKKQLKIEKENSYELREQNKKFIESKLKEFSINQQDLEKQLHSYKRKNQKNLEDLQDLQRICDETKLRNAELERIQSKYDSELYTLKNELDNEVNLRDRYKREKDQLQYDLFKMKTDLDTNKLELGYQREKNVRLEKDLKESINETNLTQDDTTQSSIKLKSIIRDLELRVKDQEDELEEQSVAIQQLEQMKLKLEMQLEKDRQKFNRELNEKESEMDDLRFNTQKKIKVLESQLEDESELNSSIQREKRELERKLRELEHPSSRHDSSHINSSIENFKKLQRLVLKYKTLAHDSHIQLEKLREQIPKQNLLKSLKNQLEDSELSRIQALKAKQLMQNEIDDLQRQIEDLLNTKQYLEEQNIHLQHEINNLKPELDDQERELNDLLKKFQHNIQNNSLDSARFIDLENKIDLFQIENQILKDKLREFETKISYYEQSYCEKSILAKYENKIKEYEIKFDLEQTQKTRLQSQIERLKQAYDKTQFQLENLSSKEKKSEDDFKKANKHNKETLEELCDLKKRLVELEETRKRLENVNEILEKELSSCKTELKVALSRLESFQTAFNSINEDNSDGEFDDDDSDEDEEDELNSDSDEDQDYTFSESTLKIKNSTSIKQNDLNVTSTTINSAKISRRETNASTC